MQSAIHVNLDGAWDPGQFDVPAVDLPDWGPRLRFCAPSHAIEEFYRLVAPRLAKFTLYGSGDFHHLAALWLRRVSGPATVVCFDNHPDWDIRPPRWCCGGWVNRALELPQVRKLSVWGCGNFELAFPHRLFGNRRAVQAGRLEIHGWAERQSARTGRLFGLMTRDDWRNRFSQFVRAHAGGPVYITIDLDCIRWDELVANWENGLFSVDDLEWALRQLWGAVDVVGGDMCGGWSEPIYARAAQRFIAKWDHPALPPVAREQRWLRNHRSARRLWSALINSS